MEDKTERIFWGAGGVVELNRIAVDRHSRGNFCPTKIPGLASIDDACIQAFESNPNLQMAGYPVLSKFRRSRWFFIFLVFDLL